MRIQTVLFTPARLLLVLAIAASAFSFHQFTLPVQADFVHSPHVQEQPESTFSCVGVEGIPETECQALVAIYDSFNGPDWTDSRGWLESNQPCEWEGVSCEEGHVTQLGFLRAGVSGTLPAAIGDLPYLQLLNLETNQLSGELPSELGSLTQLTYLNLKNNQFSGSLPETIGNLENLTELDLINNAFTGSLPSSFWSLTGLTHLYLGNNNFSGQIPAEIANLAQLKDLEIGKNQFTGSLPNEIGNLTNLNYLSIIANPLTGSLPHTIGNLTSLWTLRISNTSLGGEVPHTILNLENLRYLYLNDNQFTDYFPYGIGAMFSLKALDLSSNHFEGFDPLISSLPWLEYLNLSNNNLGGRLPEDFFMMDSLWYLDLSNNQLNWYWDLSANMPQLETLKLGQNQFAGPIPLQVLNSPKLQHLYLEDNLFSGTLPESFWSNTQLTTVNLSGNALTGQLPSTFNMPGLYYLNLSRNQFEGQLPVSIGSMKLLRTLDLSNNQFSGDLPSTLGSLVDLRTLDIRSNHFYGEFPSSITNLVNLNEPVWSAEPNGYTDLGHNHLTAVDPAVRAFLAEKDPDWESTQTYGFLPPKLISIQPSVLMAGAGDTTLKVHGSDFMNGAVVYWNGEALPTNFQSNILLKASVSASKLSNPGSIEITVKNPEPTVGPSNSRTFYITPSSNSQTIRVSLTNIGQEGNAPSSSPSISDDGRYIAFDSNASNLLPGDPIGHFHVYVYDRQTEQLERVSVTSTGELAHGSRWPTISANGRFVAFISWSSKLVSGDTGISWQIFVHDRVTGQTEIASKSPTGAPGNSSSSAPSLSADGRYIAFQSHADNLVANDNNEEEDVFVYDRETGVTKRISVSPQGEEAEYSQSMEPHVSADGRFIAFTSNAENLVPDDTNNRDDIFVHELETGNTERVSLSSSGAEANDASNSPMISADGRYVVFTSLAYNLVPDLPASGYHMKVYVHDRQTGTTEIVTPYLSTEFSPNTYRSTISHDGRFITFLSTFNPDNPSEPFENNQIFLHDRLMGKYYRLPLTWDGQAHNDDLSFHSISGDGRFIVISSDASNLVPGDTNKQTDAFLLNHCLSGSCYPIIYHPVPVIGSLNPPSAIPPAGDLILQVRGQNFVEGATILWNGEKVPTTYLAPYALETTIPAHKLVETGAVPVTVENPRPSAGPSALFNFYISDFNPADNSAIQTLRPQFRWPVVPDAIGYCIEIYGSSNFTFSNLLMTNTSTANTFTPTTNLPPNKTIYWRVSVYKNGNYDPWLPTHTFRSANPPSKPAPLSPSNNFLSTDFKPKLTWSQSSLPAGTAFEHYNLQIASDTSFETVVLNHFVSKRTQLSYTLPPGVLNPDTKYFWRVRSSNTFDHLSDWSKTFSIRAAMLPPGLFKPESGSTGLTNRPQFQWSIVENATSYTIHFSLYANFSELILSATPASNKYIPTKNLPQNRTIYWRVRSNGPNGPSVWERTSFTSANPPSNPALVSPANNSLSTNYIPKLTWRQSTLPSGTTFQHYLLQIATDSSFDPAFLVLEHAITDRTKPAYTLAPGQLQPSTQYFWRVRATNTIGHLSNWSATRTLRAAMLPPTLSAPVETSTALTPRTEFSWTAVDSASSYTIQISLYSNFSTLFLTASPISASYTPTKDLPKNKTIHWRVRANGLNGPSLWANSSFKSANPPSTPTPVSPPNNSLEGGTTPGFAWSVSSVPPGTTFSHYTLEIAHDFDFNDIFLERNKYTHSLPFFNGIPSDGFLSSKHYYWRVRSWNTLGEASSWSKTMILRISLPLPTLILPGEGVTVTTRRPEFQWSRVDGAASYTIQLSLHWNYSSPLISYTCTGNECTTYISAISLPQNRTIYWQVRANGKPYGPSPWAMGSFKSANPPSTPSLVSPSSGVRIKTLTPRLDWSTSSLPNGTTFEMYELEIATDTAFTLPIRKEVLEHKTSEWKDWAADESLLPNTRYYWRVRSINSNEHTSNWSSRWSFVTP